MLKAVLFDLDGTLLDTIPDIAAGLNGGLAACGLPTHSPRDCEAFIGGGIREAVTKAAPAGTPGEVLQQILDRYHDIYLDHCTDATRPYPGVEDMLLTLSHQGLVLGVLSNKTETTAQKIIAHFFPHIPFRCVFGRAEGRPLKPHTGAAAPALADLGLPPEEIAYVGDSGTDMTFAKAVGMLAVAAPWGYRSREELAACGADLLPDSPSELGKALLLKAAPL